MTDDQLRAAADSLDAAERAAARLADTAGTGLRRALEQAVFGGAKLQDSLRGLAAGLAKSAFRQAVNPLGEALGAAASGAIAAFGASITPFAKGGVVDHATGFQSAAGLGVMGEAGPEAILPLARGADGRLGVRGGAGRAVQVTMNVSTPDAQSFARSHGQIAAQLARAVEMGRGRV